VLVFAPGAWVTFGLRLRDVPFWARLLSGAVLSPLVVCLQFYCLRLAGLRFEAAILSMVAVNAPAVWLIAKQAGSVPVRRAWLFAAAAVLVPVVCLAEYLIYPAARIFTPHAWIYADPVYLFARGDLILEDPALAGVRLGYPVWSALVLQAAHSFLVN